MINFDKPDFVIASIGGGAGRFLTHLVMLSPEVHTWNTQLEEKLNGLPVAEHSEIKYKYIVSDVFPVQLKNNNQNWKKFEPAPWHALYNPTKKFIRHSWMRESISVISNFSTSKIAFVNYFECLYFVLKCAIEKEAFCLVNHNPKTGEGPGNWYKAETKEESVSLIKSQLYQALSELGRWQSYNGVHDFHEINLNRLLFKTFKDFVFEYRNLCNYFEVTPDVPLANNLKKHWLSLHNFSKNDKPTVYDIAWVEFLQEICSSYSAL